MAKFSSSFFKIFNETLHIVLTDINNTQRVPIPRKIFVSDHGKISNGILIESSFNLSTNSILYEKIIAMILNISVQQVIHVQLSGLIYLYTICVC